MGQGFFPSNIVTPKLAFRSFLIFEDIRFPFKIVEVTRNKCEMVIS